MFKMKLFALILVCITVGCDSVPKKTEHDLQIFELNHKILQAKSAEFNACFKNAEPEALKLRYRLHHRTIDIADAFSVEKASRACISCNLKKTPLLEIKKNSGENFSSSIDKCLRDILNNTDFQLTNHRFDFEDVSIVLNLN